MADISVPMPDWQAPLLALQQQNSPVAQGQAAVLQQQATGANIANQRAALGLQLYRRVLGDFTGQRFQGVPDDSSGTAGAEPGESDESGETGSGSANATPPPGKMAAASGAQPGTGAQVGGLQGGGSTQEGADDSATVDSGFPDDWNPTELREKFFVNPAGNARSQGMLLEASMTGDPGLMAYAKSQRDLQVQSDTAQSQKQAQDLYDLMGTVASAPKGAALATLGRISPALAGKIEKTYENDPADADAAARATALHLAAVTHQYTGRPLVLGPDGVYRDKVTGMRVPVPVAGMSPADYAKLSAKGEAMVSVPNSDGSSSQMPLWQADHAPNLAAWAAQQAARGQAQLHPAVAPAVARLNAAAQAPQPGKAPPQAVHPGLTASPAQAQSALTMQRALSDPEYKLQQPRVVSGQTATPAVLAQQQATVKSRAQLMQDAQAATQTAAQTLTYLTAAQAVLNSPGHVPTGLSAGAQALIGRALQGTGASATDWASKYQEVAKFLSNAALQSARQTYGARMTQSEVKLQLENMNPNAHMTPAALKALIAENIRQSTYTLANARRVVPYLRSGNDPQSFAQWSQQYFPMQKIVNTPTKANAAPAPVRVTSAAQAAALPKGTRFITPDGRTLVRN